MGFGSVSKAIRLVLAYSRRPRAGPLRTAQLMIEEPRTDTEGYPTRPTGPMKSERPPTALVANWTGKGRESWSGSGSVFWGRSGGVG